MKLGGYVLLAILAVVCLEETTAGKDVNASSCEALNHLREAVTSFQDTVTEMQATVNNQSDVLSNILATLEEVQETYLAYKPASCLDVMEYDTSNSVHTLTVGNRLIEVFCDQTTAGGGWTVIQRRVDGQVDFFRYWGDYERGFGNVTGEFWLGLDNIHRMTSSQKYSLRVDLEASNGSTAYAEYREFSIRGFDRFYRLHISGYSNNSTAGDAMIGTIRSSNLNNMLFSTPEYDHDRWFHGNCARVEENGWWYNSCSRARPNSPYSKGTLDMWEDWKHGRSVKHVEMKIRPWT